MQQRRLFFDSSFEPMNWWNATGERRDSSFKWGWGWKLEWEVNTAAKEETIHFFFTFKYINAPHQSVTMQFKKKIEKMWTGWHLYPVHKFTNRMRSTYHPSGLQFFYLMITGQGGVRFTTYKPDGTPIQSIRLTIYEPDVRLSGSQISKNENRMVSSGCPARNFQVA